MNSYRVVFRVFRTFKICLVSLVLSTCLLSSPTVSWGQSSQEETPPLPPPLNLPLASADVLSNGGTFWSLQISNSAPLPFNPFPEVAVYDLGGGQFIFDDRAIDYIELEQQRELEETLLQATALSLGLAVEGDELGWSVMLFSALYTTNDLWLEISGMTNTVANLVIHTPWNDTNLTYDLFYTTNLASPIDWRFFVRCVSTNVAVPDLCDEQGFFRLGQTNGDLTVTTNATPQELAQMLVTSWVIVTNVIYTGAIAARGIFTGGNGCGLPIDSGVVISSGNITNTIGPNNQSGATTAFYDDTGIAYRDPDLSNLVGGGPTLDSAVLEFDVISTNSFVLQFQYVFASEEYPEYIGSFNDPMAIFVTTNRVDTSWINSITNDIALVPVTNYYVPASVNNINGGCIALAEGGEASPTNAQYYADNHDPTYSAVFPYKAAAPLFNVQYDGMTTLLTGQVSISADVTNHVKVAIADYAGTRENNYFDSAVFIKAWSPCQCY